jgi:hypothetical protein
MAQISTSSLVRTFGGDGGASWSHDDPVECIVSVSSGIYSNRLTSSEIRPPSIKSISRRLELEGPMMTRGRGYKRPVGDTGVCFGHRLGLQDCSTSTSPAKPAKQMYSGNISRKIPSSQTPSVPSQSLSLPPSPLLGEPEPYCKPILPSPSSHCGTQAKSIQPSWFESGTAFLGKAKSFCKESASHFGKTAGGWTERWALSGYQGTARQSSYGSHLQNMMRGRNPSSTMGELVKAWAAKPQRLWTRCTANRRTEAASRSEIYDEEREHRSLGQPL